MGIASGEGREFFFIQGLLTSRPTPIPDRVDVGNPSSATRSSRQSQFGGGGTKLDVDVLPQSQIASHLDCICTPMHTAPRPAPLLCSDCAPYFCFLEDAALGACPSSFPSLLAATLLNPGSKFVGAAQF